MLSGQSGINRRQLIRVTWGRSDHIGLGEVRLRFVLAAGTANEAEIVAEHAAHTDLHVAVGDSDGMLYMNKVLHWLRHLQARFCAVADDDAYIVVCDIVGDLRAADDAGTATTAQYAAYEWFAYHRNRETRVTRAVRRFARLRARYIRGVSTSV